MATRTEAGMPLGVPSASDAALAARAAGALEALIEPTQPGSVRIGDQTVDIPAPALHLLREILDWMAQGKGVALTPLHAELTTRQAAARSRTCGTAASPAVYGSPAPGRASPGCSLPASRPGRAGIRPRATAPGRRGKRSDLPRNPRLPSCVGRLEDRTGKGYLRSCWAWRFRCLGRKSLDNELLPDINDLRHVRHHILAPPGISRAGPSAFGNRGTNAAYGVVVDEPVLDYCPEACRAAHPPNRPSSLVFAQHGNNLLSILRDWQGCPSLCRKRMNSPSRPRLAFPDLAFGFG